MGSLGTGKTTLCRALADQFAITMIQEDLAELVELATEATETRRNIQDPTEPLNRYTRATLEWLKKRDDLQRAEEHFTSDCCCFDILCTWIRLLNISGENDAILKLLISIC